jgi:hypothetical protein
MPRCHPARAGFRQADGGPRHYPAGFVAARISLAPDFPITEGKQQMLINIRGTHGSGKSTIVRSLLHAGDARPLYGALKRRPEAYEVTLAGKPAYIIGPYETPCGGADCIQPYRFIVPLIMKYGAVGHVIFEGALVSSCWGIVGRLIERWGREAIIAFLDTPVSECVRRVEARRAQRGDGRALNPANLIQKHDAIARLKVKLDAAGIVRTITLSSEDAAAMIFACVRPLTGG